MTDEPTPEPQRSPGPWSTPPPAPKPKLPLLAGALAGVVTPIFLSVVPVVVTNGATVAGYGLLSWLVVPVVGVALLVAPATRRWGAGVLLGFFGMLVVGAGACVAILVAVNAGGGVG